VNDVAHGAEADDEEALIRTIGHQPPERLRFKVLGLWVGMLQVSVA
jgi:hypothetical protein